MFQSSATGLFICLLKVKNWANLLCFKCRELWHLLATRIYSRGYWLSKYTNTTTRYILIVRQYGIQLREDWRSRTYVRWALKRPHTTLKDLLISQLNVSTKKVFRVRKVGNPTSGFIGEKCPIYVVIHGLRAWLYVCYTSCCVVQTVDYWTSAMIYKWTIYWFMALRARVSGDIERLLSQSMTVFVWWDSLLMVTTQR